jgi:aspartate/methionine/tyrosine aminotransferase
MTLPPLIARLLIQTRIVRLLPGLQRRLEGGAEYLRYYSDRLLAAPLERLERIAASLADDSPDVIDLAGGSPRFDLTPLMAPRLPASRRGWPPLAGLPELRGAVAAHLLADCQIAVSPTEELLITSGALGAVQTILDAFVNRGDRVLLLDPVSPLYPLAVQSRGAKVAWVGTRVEKGYLRLRFDHLSRRMRGVRLIVLNSPANPTGAILAPEDLEQISWWAEKHDTLILSDEVFGRFGHDEEPTSVGSLPRARLRTLTVGSVSKSHALAWARVGWVAAQRHLLRPCLATAALRSPFVSTHSQEVALAALQTPPEAFAPHLALLDSRRRYAVERLRALGLSPIWPAAGYFVWMGVPDAWHSGRALADALLGMHRVRVLPGDLFGPSGARFVRLSLLTDDGRLEEGLTRLGLLIQGERQRVPVRRAA